MAITGRRPTLSDCECEVTVYADGSGIEVHYCPMHQAAKQMLETLRKAEHMVSIGNDPNKGCRNMGAELVGAMRAAIKAAEEA